MHIALRSERSSFRHEASAFLMTLHVHSELRLYPEYTSFDGQRLAVNRTRTRVIVTYITVEETSTTLTDKEQSVALPTETLPQACPTSMWTILENHIFDGISIGFWPSKSMIPRQKFHSGSHIRAIPCMI